MAGPLLFLVGPTASGKKQAALHVQTVGAATLPVELLALDSMKVYRGMDVGTDKLAAGRFALTDLVDASERFSVGAYVRAAQAEVAAVRARGRSPLFVGGTGLYLRALVRGLFEVPDIPPPIRAQVQEQLDRDGAPAVHAELARVDPATALRLHANDRKRIARAFEVWLATGRPLSRWQAEATRRPIDGEAAIVGIRWSRAALHARIAARVARMFERGLVDEVRRLVEPGGDAAGAGAARIGPVAGMAIGYREVVAMLRERSSIEECRRAVISDTTAFVRRQDNWLRQFPEIRWVEADADPASVPERVAQAFRAALASPPGDPGVPITGGSDRPSRS